MILPGTFSDWNRLLPDRNLPSMADFVPTLHAGKTILITGAGGSIGSALARSIAVESPELLLLLDHSEQNLYEIETELSSLSSAPKFIAVLGDAADAQLIAALFEEHRPSVIYHAAAFKHVPLMEANPFAAIRNNALATWHLAHLAAENEIPQLLLISTDKAANPRSIMGASKRLAELAVMRWNSPTAKCSAVRLGNVLGSHGSVIPLFLRQIEQGKNLTVTHREISRYFLTMEETVRTIFKVASLETNGGLFLPEMGDAIKIRTLAARLLELVSQNGRCQSSVEFTGLRPGDKLMEDLLSPTEALEVTALRGIHRIRSEEISPEALDSAFERIAMQTQARDLSGVLDSIRTIVPEYEPSSELQRRASSELASSSRHA